VSKWKTVRLEDVCTINMGQSPDSSSYNQEGSGIPFYQGNADFGDLHPVTRFYCSQPIKIARKGDILISVRAPIGAINIATETCCIGRGLAALTAIADQLDTKYLFYVLSYKNNELNNKGTGSTFKAISKQTLSEVKLPLPPLEIQRKIAKTLDTVSEILAMRKQQLAELDNLIKSIFYDMFGDPVTNEKGWEIKKLSDIGEVNRGVSKHRPRNDPKLLGGQYPLIQTGEVANADVIIRNYTQTYSELGFEQSKMWDSGTLCITIAANIAKTAILGFNACFPDSIVGFIANDLTNNIFVHYWFGFFQKILELQAPESAQKNINLKILRELDVIVPPIQLQNRFADYVSKALEQKLSIKKAFDETQYLFDSLMSLHFD
jgi:type I restriction enzyme S subunit